MTCAYLIFARALPLVESANPPTPNTHVPNDDVASPFTENWIPWRTEVLENRNQYDASSRRRLISPAVRLCWAYWSHTGDKNVLSGPTGPDHPTAPHCELVVQVERALLRRVAFGSKAAIVIGTLL